jgi:hypothetical protein
MTYRPRYEMSTQDGVRELLEKWRPRWDAPANDAVVVDLIEKTIATREEILNAIDRLGDERKIIYAPAVAEALQAAKNNHPYNSFDAYAVEKRVIDKAEELKFNIRSAGDLSDVMDWMVENEQVPLSAAGKEWRNQQHGIEQRTNEINSITKNYSTGFKLRSPNGAYHSMRVFDKDGFEIQFSSSGGGRTKPKGGGFDALSNEEVHDIYLEVTEERRLRGLSKNELKAEINPQRQQKYEASSRSMQPNPLGTQLINPDNGQVIDNKRDLIRFINSGRDNTKRLLQRRGETDKTLAKEFERILNS